MDTTKCNLKVNSPHVQYTEEAIETNYDYATSSVKEDVESGTYFVSLSELIFVKPEPELAWPNIK